MCYTYVCVFATDLEEPTDGLLVLSSHGHHILIQPEQRLLLTGRRLDIAQQSEELKEQPTSPFCKAT